MKTLILKMSVFAIALVIGMSAAYADIHVIIYGKGGTIVNPSNGTAKVCPEASQQKCAELVLDDITINGSKGPLNGTLIINGRSYSVEVVEMPNLQKTAKGYACQGIVVKAPELKDQ